MDYNLPMTELAVILANQGLEAFLEHIHAMTALVNKDGSLVSWNRAFEQCKPAFSPSNKLHDFFPEGERAEIQSRLTTNEKKRWFMKFITSVEDQPVLCDCLLIPLPENQLLFIAERIEADTSLSEIVQQLNKQVKLFQVESEVAKKLAHRKHTEVEGVMAQAHEISQLDPLTFLPNRRMIVRELQDEVLRAERYHSPLSISIVDVDHFKNVNDTYGHLAGDEVLRQVAIQLRDNIRHPDLAGRFGGEEFLILLPNSSSTAASEQAARLCKCVREMVVRTTDQTVQVTISIGIGEFNNGVDTWETLVNRADKALYRAKTNGRDRWSTAE
jgi:diguanylate cyclase (GGDEF)-like protein